MRFRFVLLFLLCVPAYSQGRMLPDIQNDTSSELEPLLIEKGDKLCWGLSQDELFVKKNSGGNWKKEADLGSIFDWVTVINDSLVELWSDRLGNFRYSLTDHRLYPYVPDNPLSRFLSAPIISLRI